MKGLKIIVFTITTIVASIPGLLWQIIAPLIGWEIFGPQEIDPPFKMIMRGLPSTIISFTLVFILINYAFKKVVEKTSKKWHVTIGVVTITFIACWIGFVINWLCSEVITLLFGLF